MAHPSVGSKWGAEMVPSIDRLCAEFGGPLKRFIARRVWNGHDAEDLLQEVFLKAHVAIHDLRDTERVRPWLYRVAANAVADHHRERQLADLPLMADEFVEETPGAVNANSEVARCLGPIVDELPEGYRRALVLADLEGRPQREVAEELGLSLSGAKSRVQRARRKLRATLLSCCRFDLDPLGNVLDWHPRAAPAATVPAEGGAAPHFLASFSADLRLDL
jgi:RNA polymerase sigma-70 factor, ECF subfamily